MKRKKRRKPLNAINARPGRHQRQNLRQQVDQHVGCVVLVPARLPQLVQASAANHQCGVQLQSVGAKRWRREILPKLLQIALESHVGQVGHHVCDDFEAAIFGQMKRLQHCRHRVTTGKNQQ